MKSNPNQKMKIIVDSQSYFVDIVETSDNTLEVTVDGQCFRIQIQPESQNEPDHVITNQEKTTEQAHRIINASDAPELYSSDLRAPLPGNITEIMVKEGDVVEVDQELCVIEAMKMKNVLRSSRNGRITAVDVSIGETVPYNKTLIRFA
ncbi:MAG: hypothetical protein IMY76_01400 [Chloroflexi bacterium]|nr:hypothetical protein [Chloroflexota bacterium]